MVTQPHKGHICRARHSFALDNFIRRLFQKPLKIAGPYIKKGDRVIDMGCGPGFFSIAMAKMAGPSGQVIALDLQREMLDKVARKARKKGLEDRIRLHQCPQDNLGLDPDIKANFILAFYMVHETPDPRKFFIQAKPHLKPGGRFLVVEPRFHVTRKKFAQISEYALDAGFEIIGRPSGKGGPSLLLGIG